MTIDFKHPARLYLGVNREAAFAQDAKTYKTAAAAIRFALEEAAPVSLRGASLVVGSTVYSGEDMKTLYASSAYPLKRKADRQREFA